MIKKWLLSAMLILTSVVGVGQSVAFWSDRAVGVFPFGNGNVTGLVPIQYGPVRVCTIPASGSPCTPVASITDINGNALTINGGNFGQLTTDVVGRFAFGCTPGNYLVQVAASSNNVPVLSYPVTCPSGSSLLTSNNIWSGINTFNGLTNLVGGGSFGASWTKGTASSPYILQLKDAGGLNNQLIGFNIEQEYNPTSSANYLSFAQASEIFTPTSNSQTFPSQTVSVYGSASHFGSGAINSIFGGNFEGFNSGPSTATLIAGVGATANNGGVAAGSPVQTPTNNGNANNLRAFDGIAKNFSSGVVTNAVNFYAEGVQNTGGGTIINAIGLDVAAINGATNNYAIRTSTGQVVIGDVATFNSRVGIGGAPISQDSLLVNPISTLTGTGQAGIQSAPTCSSSATVTCVGVMSRADTQTAAFTNNLLAAFFVQDAIKGAGSTITKQVGLEVPTLSSGATNLAIETGANPSIFGGNITAPSYATTTNCASTGGTCGSAASGSVGITNPATTVTISTTAVTANSVIFVFEDSTLGTKLGATCNATLGRTYMVTTRTANTSFIITASATPAANTACLNYLIIN